MKLYFIKSKYTGNVYKISDFYNIDGSPKIGQYNATADEINFKPDDGITSIILRNYLHDEDNFWKTGYTHVWVEMQKQADLNSPGPLWKLYKIAASNYEARVTNFNESAKDTHLIELILDEDPLIGNYQTLKDKTLLLSRTNEEDYFVGINDIDDVTLVRNAQTRSINTQYRSGKWALVMLQYDTDIEKIGFKFRTENFTGYEWFLNITELKDKYPEIIFNHDENVFNENEIEYFQKIVRVGPSGDDNLYQCTVRITSATQSILSWNIIEPFPAIHDTFYLKMSTIKPTKAVASDIYTVNVLMPFDTMAVDFDYERFISFHNFIGVTNPDILIDIKIIDEHLWPIPPNTANGNVNKNERWFYDWNDQSVYVAPSYDNDDNIITNFNFMLTTRFTKEIDVSLLLGPSPELSPLDAEPFKEYELYIYGNKFKIPAMMIRKIKMLIAFNSGVINYLLFYNDNKNNIIGSGSFTHSARSSADQLDMFYALNPTYKDQFLLKQVSGMATGIIGGAAAGSVIPGVGTAIGAGVGAIAGAADVGLSYLNLHLQEKAMRLKPDQLFGETSETALQIANLFGIYWVIKSAGIYENQLKMQYLLRGFPVKFLRLSIEDVDYSDTVLDAIFNNQPVKVIYGRLLETVVDNYVTDYINAKLSEGVIFLE